MRTRQILLLVIFVAVLFSGYKPNNDDHVRFGVPSRDGIIVSRQGFITCYSKEYGMPLWVSYHLRKPPEGKRPVLRKQYVQDIKIRSGSTDPSKYENIAPYEPAKMAPAKHMPDKQLLTECYVTSNVCPMHEGLSRGPWMKLENMVYEFAKKNGGLWVISGPVFAEGSVKKTKTGLRVPDAFFKVLIYQGDDYAFRASAFIMKNRPSDADIYSMMVSVADVEKATGLKFATAMPEDVRAQLVNAKPAPEILKGMLD